MNSKLLLAAIAALWLDTASLAAEEPRVLDLAPNCTAVLSKEINWELMDIISCPIKESLYLNEKRMPSVTITDWELTQKMWFLIAPDLPAGHEIEISPNSFIWKSIDGKYYSRDIWYTQILPTQGFNCFTIPEDFWMIVCKKWVEIPTEYTPLELQDTWKIEFPNGHTIYFEQEGSIWIKPNGTPV